MVRIPDVDAEKETKRINRFWSASVSPLHPHLHPNVTVHKVNAPRHWEHPYRVWLHSRITNFIIMGSTLQRTTMKKFTNMYKIIFPHNSLRVQHIRSNHAQLCS